MKTVGVEELAKVFRVSPRQVQKFAEREGMPRETHGRYNLAVCMAWYIRRLHRKICGCAGPCDGFRSSEREMVNLRAERKKALNEAFNIAPGLVGLDSNTIRERLTAAVKETFEIFELAGEEK